MVTEAQSCHAWLLYHLRSFSSEAGCVFLCCLVAAGFFLEMALSVCRLVEVPVYLSGT